MLQRVYRQIRKVDKDAAVTIATVCGVETMNVLTGFKFIGEQIGILEKEGRVDRYISVLRNPTDISAARMCGIRTESMLRIFSVRCSAFIRQRELVFWISWKT